MSIKTYLSGVAAEFALVAAAAACLTTVVLQGFVVDPALQFNPLLMGGVSCAFQAILFAAAYRKQNLVAGGAAYAVATALAVAVGLATSTGADPMADVEENHLVVAAVLALANLLVFLLSRTPAGLVALTAAGLFSCAYVEYVYHAGLALPSVLFAVCLTALFAVRSYAASVRAADTLGRAAFGWAALTGVAVALVAAGLAWAVWALLVAPLEPGRVELKLFVEERAFETVEVNNPVELVKIEDPEQTTMTLTDEVIYGSIPVEVQADEATLSQVEEFVENSRAQVGNQDVFSLTVDEENGVYLYTYSLPAYWWLLLALVPVALVLAAVLVRRVLRARARAAIAACEPREQVGRIYTASLGRLGRLGLGKVASQTPAEFAAASAGRMEAFCAADAGRRAGGAAGQVSGADSSDARPADWAQVSAAYERCHYGACEPSAEELAACWRFYDGFARRACSLVGRPRYCLKYFWTL